MKTKVGAVSYLNTKPLLYGIRRHRVLSEMELTEDYPAAIARKLIDGTLDIGLVPVAAVPKIPDAQILTNYCIGCNGPVASVCIFSEVPMERVETVVLDYQSRTSVALARILLKEYWKKEVRFVNATNEDFRQAVKGSVAAVVIGDRALEQRARSNYIYDLGEAWQGHTGLPFVFAAWVSNKPLPDGFIEQFNDANALGLRNVEAVIAQERSDYSLRRYYTENIRYVLDAEAKRGFSLFLRKLEAVKTIPL